METNNRRVLDHQINFLKTFLAINPTMRIAQIRTLYIVAMSPGLSITDLARVGGLSLAAASRYVMALSGHQRGSGKGLGLIAIGQTSDARLKPLRLTKRGWEVLRQAGSFMPEPRAAGAEE